MENKKYAVITGGSSGLGLSLSKELASQGYVPVIISRSGDRVNKAVENLKAQGFEAIGLPGDVSSAADMQTVSQKVRDLCGNIDFLILNAGVVHVGLLADYTDMNALTEDIKTDLIGTVISTRMFLPLLASGSRILMISSAFGIIGGAAYSTYCAAKAGVVNFAGSLRRELLCKNISVYVACPADIDTPQYAYERSTSPAWLKSASGRKSLLSADTAAQRILKKARGKRHLIIINPEIKFLQILTKLLPERLVLLVGDLAIPKPKA
ncbi:MAG: hypothetical protein A2X34_04050 [Elusimicrobia bacterium GWC2_51_8]|nr:MAG: hypothetical protein A2X33_02100 [Elusimicrobia bacterium GWA2_51_34]OGR60497.1 MAG: hypothetical protein A2X34_04050 [Elusimicrobia bacterium GWC2_51_8]OGR86495.1 MAG: hypothetical protein A2021_09540 [Elusimicrobia bacterium GWF2_52_66]HAF94657.1 hypothetical protein [Elusimicrobiota bacterium]HCE97928.1 hypothetical protein [Elusimicrobiota bacterium]